VPPHLICPLSKEPFLEPVVLAGPVGAELSGLQEGDTVDLHALRLLGGASSFVPNLKVAEMLEDFACSNMAASTPIAQLKRQDVHATVAVVLNLIIVDSRLLELHERARALAAKALESADDVKTRRVLVELVALLARKERRWPRFRRDLVGDPPRAVPSKRKLVDDSAGASERKRRGSASVGVGIASAGAGAVAKGPGSKGSPATECDSNELPSDGSGLIFMKSALKTMDQRKDEDKEDEDAVAKGQGSKGSSVPAAECDSKALPSKQEMAAIQVNKSLGWQIVVKTLMGTTITLDGLGPSSTVEELKRKVETSEGIPVDQQRIIFDGKALENWLRLGDYKIEDNTTLHLVMALRGGMHHDSSGKTYVVAACGRRRTLYCRAFPWQRVGGQCGGCGQAAVFYVACGVASFSVTGSIAANFLESLLALLLAGDLLMRFVCCCWQAPSYHFNVTAQASQSSLLEESTPRSRAGRAASSAWCL